MIFEIEIYGNWRKVTYGIFRSWTGKRRCNGEPWNGPVHQYGEGLPNPWTEADEALLIPKEMA